MRKLAIRVDWQGSLDREALFGQVAAAEAGGVHVVWVAEAWGRDAFTTLVQLAERTRRVQLGTGVVNIFSRSPAALAQHFATLDEISAGRALIGLGASGPQVIEHFHGVPFRRPLRRMREYVEIIDTLLGGRPLQHEGEIFRLQRGFKLRFTPLRPHIPIFVAAMGPRSVRQTAALADGWMPIWTPLQEVAGHVAAFREAAAAAGRDPAILQVCSPGTTVVAADPAGQLRAARRRLAFYVARMGTFYFEHLTRLGMGETAAAIRDAFAAGGSAAGAEAVPENLSQAMGLVTGSVQEARERLAAEAAAGVDIHLVAIEGFSPAQAEKIYAQLAA